MFILESVMVTKSWPAHIQAYVEGERLESKIFLNSGFRQKETLSVKSFVLLSSRPALGWWKITVVKCRVILS